MPCENGRLARLLSSAPPFDLGHVSLVGDGLDRHDVLLGSLRGAQGASEAALICIGRSRHAGARVVVGRRRIMSGRVSAMSAIVSFRQYEGRRKGPMGAQIPLGLGLCEPDDL